jgi:hypothetical protein
MLNNVIILLNNVQAKECDCTLKKLKHLSINYLYILNDT